MAGHWLAELDGSKVTVEVPASSANLGAGYDCLGLALAITNRIELEVRVWSRGEIELTVEGEGRNELTRIATNRFVRGLEARPASRPRRAPRGRRLADRDAQPDPAGARPRARRRRRRSAASWSATRSPARRCRCPRCSSSPARSRATRTTPRPRSSAGSSCRRRDGGGVEAIRFDSPRDLRAVLFIPELRLPTDEMRAALPAKVPLADAVANLGAVAVGVAGLATGRYDLLARLTVDRLHEPYRAAVYPQPAADGRGGP